MMRQITDWNAVYDNTPAIPDGASWPGRWVQPAQEFRDRMQAQGRARLGLSYGPAARNHFDLFLPETPPAGLVIFVHGGFWMGLDRSLWSHLAAGPLAHGYAVAIPDYTLCPNINIAGITQEIAAMIAVAADLVPGPIRLAGHSAGGQLVTRMVCEDGPLAAPVADRIAAVLSISGLHDLRPMRRIWRQETLRLSEAESWSESPALLSPRPGLRLICWVGACETSEFRRQNALLANIWQGLGAAIACVEEPDRHHFNIMDGLFDPSHPMTAALMA